MVRTPMEYIYTRSKKTKSNVYKKIQIIYILFIIIIYFYNSPIRSPFYGGQKMVAPVGVKPLTLPFELERTTWSHQWIFYLYFPCFRARREPWAAGAAWYWWRTQTGPPSLLTLRKSRWHSKPSAPNQWVYGFIQHRCIPLSFCWFTSTGLSRSNGELHAKTFCGSFQDNMAITCGSRAHLEQDSVAEVSVGRGTVPSSLSSLPWLTNGRVSPVWACRSRYPLLVYTLS